METGPHFRYLTLATLVGVFALIVLGGVVRITESGLGCPDWPLCHGRIIPPFDAATLIEYSHRLVASVVGLLVLATLIVAWRHYRSRAWIFRPALFGLVMVIGQSALGGAAVLTELESYIVMIHMAMAQALLACFALVHLDAWRGLSLAGRRLDGRVCAFGRRGSGRAPADSDGLLCGVERRCGGVQPVAAVPRREVLRCLRTPPHPRSAPVGVRDSRSPSGSGGMVGVAFAAATGRKVHDAACPRDLRRAGLSGCSDGLVGPPNGPTCPPRSPRHADMGRPSNRNPPPVYAGEEASGVAWGSLANLSNEGERSEMANQFYEECGNRDEPCIVATPASGGHFVRCSCTRAIKGDRWTPSRNGTTSK